MRGINYKSIEELKKRSEISVNGCIELYLRNHERYSVGTIFVPLEKDPEELRSKDVDGYYNVKVGKFNIKGQLPELFRHARYAKETPKKITRKQREAIYLILKNKETFPAPDNPRHREIFEKI